MLHMRSMIMWFCGKEGWFDFRIPFAGLTLTFTFPIWSEIIFVPVVFVALLLPVTNTRWLLQCLICDVCLPLPCRDAPGQSFLWIWMLIIGTDRLCALSCRGSLVPMWVILPTVHIQTADPILKASYHTFFFFFFKAFYFSFLRSTYTVLYC